MAGRMGQLEHRECSYQRRAWMEAECCSCMCLPSQRAMIMMMTMIIHSFKQFLFSSETFRKNKKTSEHASVTASVICEPLVEQALQTREKRGCIGFIQHFWCYFDRLHQQNSCPFLNMTLWCLIFSVSCLKLYQVIRCNEWLNTDEACTAQGKNLKFILAHYLALSPSNITVNKLEAES